MKSICVLLMCVFAVSGQVVSVVNSTVSHEPETTNVLQNLFSYFNKQIIPEVNNYITKGKDFIRQLQVQKLGNGILETALDLMNTTHLFMQELDLANYTKLFDKTLEDAKTIASNVVNEVEDFLKKLQVVAVDMKGKIPTNVASLISLKNELKSLQSKMASLQTKANAAYQEGQEKLLETLEEQLVMVREQLKAAKNLTMMLKENIAETMTELKDKAVEIGGDVNVKLEEMITKAAEKFKICQQKFEDALEKFTARARHHLKILGEKVQNMTANMETEISGYLSTLNNTVFDVKDNVLDYSEQLMNKAIEYKDTLKDTAGDIKTKVTGQMSTLKGKTADHLNKMLATMKVLGTTLRNQMNETAVEWKGNLQDLLKQYQTTMATALKLQKDARNVIRELTAKMSTGSQTIFENTKKIAQDNLELAMNYTSMAQDFFSKQWARLMSQNSINATPTEIPTTPSISAKKMQYLRMQKKLRSRLSPK